MYQCSSTAGATKHSHPFRFISVLWFLGVFKYRKYNHIIRQWHRNRLKENHTHTHTHTQKIYGCEFITQTLMFLQRQAVTQQMSKNKKPPAAHRAVCVTSLWSVFKWSFSAANSHAHTKRQIKNKAERSELMQEQSGVDLSLLGEAGLQPAFLHRNSLSVPTHQILQLLFI